MLNIDNDDLFISCISALRDKDIITIYSMEMKLYDVWIEGKEEFKITDYHSVYVQEQG